MLLCLERARFYRYEAKKFVDYFECLLYSNVLYVFWLVSNLEVAVRTNEGSFMYKYVYIYIHIYIHREKEREGETFMTLCVSKNGDGDKPSARKAYI